MQHLILLHGAIGHSKQLLPLAAHLENEYTIHMLNFSGHGGESFPGENFSIPLFAAEVIAYMDAHNIDNASIFGYSMGGYVAMYMAKHFSNRVNKVITLATKFHWDGPTAEKECKMLDSAKIEEKLPSFAQYLQKSHAPNDWKEVLAKTREMLQALGADNTLKPADYSGIETPVLILLGDRDKMVMLEETVAVYKALPGAQMGMLPNTQHPIEQVKPEVLGYYISYFLKN